MEKPEAKSSDGFVRVSSAKVFVEDADNDDSKGEDDDKFDGTGRRKSAAMVKYQDTMKKFDLTATERLAKDQEEVKAQIAHFERLVAVPKRLILPDSRLMGRWDMVTVFALLYTALVTPYEVITAWVSAACAREEKGCGALDARRRRPRPRRRPSRVTDRPSLRPPFLLRSPRRTGGGSRPQVALLKTQYNEMFFVNRLIDLIFCVDMCLQFFLAYRDETKAGGRRLVKDFTMIRRRYMRGWFPIDLISVVPFDVIGILLQSRALQRLKLMRLLKLLRLLKVGLASVGRWWWFRRLAGCSVAVGGRTVVGRSVVRSQSVGSDRFGQSVVRSRPWPAVGSAGRSLRSVRR